MTVNLLVTKYTFIGKQRTNLSPFVVTIVAVTSTPASLCHPAHKIISSYCFHNDRLYWERATES